MIIVRFQKTSEILGERSDNVLKLHISIMNCLPVYARRCGRIQGFIFAFGQMIDNLYRTVAGNIVIGFPDFGLNSISFKMVESLLS
jgi:hypothetical protein